MVVIRQATPEDLAQLAGVEAAADQLFATVMDTSGWRPPEPGARRADRPGFILVAAADHSPQRVLGFAHVIQVDPSYHLEHVAVDPTHGHAGLGTALLRAAEAEVAARGGVVITLMTYETIQWNAPFFESRGYELLVPPPDHLREFVDAQARQQPPDSGARVCMVKLLGEPVTPLPAVSVIPVRDGRAGLEVFVQHRSATMDFAAGAVVFPGGRVDQVDRDHPARLEPGRSRLHTSAWRECGFVREARDPAVAVRILVATAVREVKEETGAEVGPDELQPWDNWITPPGVPRRFDVHFFMWPVGPDDQRALANTTTEAVASQWLPVTEVLQRATSRELTLMTPTRILLRELRDLGSLEAVLQARPVIEPVLLDRSMRRPRPPRAADLAAPSIVAPTDIL